MNGDGIEPWAWGIVKLADTYTEISPSGEGLRIIGRAKLPGNGQNKDDREIYDHKRYLTITGHHLEGTPATIEDRQAEFEAIYDLIAGIPEPKQKAPAPAAPPNLDDAELIRRAKAASNGTVFERLWNGDTSGHPSPSEADLALCNHLAFWTGNDPTAIDRLFRQSGLFREKWDVVHHSGGQTYGEGTVEKAINGTSETYSSPGPPAPVEPPPPEPGPVEASTVAPALDAYALTDLGNSEPLAARHGDDLRWCELWGHWLVWDDKHWSRDDTRQVGRWAVETVRAMYLAAFDEPDPERRKALGAWASKSESGHRRREMINGARDFLPILPDQLDADPWLLTVNNGTLDLRTGELYPHRRTDYITKLAPVAYDPAAKAPIFDAFLKRIMDDNQDLIGFLQRAAGYSLTSDTREQCFFILHGIGANGKSTLVEALMNVAGDYALKTPTETLLIRRGTGIPNDVARLKGARLVTAVEAERGQRLAEALVKQFTGGDTMVARFLRAEFFDFRPEFKLWLATNHRPEVRGTDHAIWRRIHLIPFHVTIPEDEQDKALPDKLNSELPGILAWAVRGCLDWQRDGLGTPDEVKRATANYRAEMDVLAGWLEDCCYQEENAEGRAGELYKSYREWCERAGERALTSKYFKTALLERGFARDRDNKGVFYTGLGLLSPQDDG
jgi:putative DNA primase/helicase